jgi:hypothetical protein
VFLYAGSLAFASAAILLPIHLRRSNPQIV